MLFKNLLLAQFVRLTLGRSKADRLHHSVGVDQILMVFVFRAVSLEGSPLVNFELDVQLLHAIDGIFLRDHRAALVKRLLVTHEEVGKVLGSETDLATKSTHIVVHCKLGRHHATLS